MKAAIVGGGIGGLSAAIALRKKGIRADVFEAAPELREVGAGIWMPANAMQVLDRLGLAGAVLASGAPLRRAEVYDLTGGLLQAIDFTAFAQRFGFGTVAIHRGRLQALLAAVLPSDSIHTAKRLVTLTPGAETVTAEFADGERVSADLLIAADGLRSPVRRQLFPRSHVRFAGQTSYRGVARVELPPDVLDSGREIWGPGRRFGFSPIAPGEVYWFAVADSPEGQSEDQHGMAVRLTSSFESFPGIVRELIAGTPSTAITRTDLYDLPPLPRWHSGPIVLLGDAAHATTPNLGQGGAQAIEDAYSLAEALAAHPLPTALEVYQRIRKPKADHVVRTSRRLGTLAHLRNPVARALRNLAIRSTPTSVAERQFSRLFQLPS